MFKDRVRIKISAGRGGNGVVRFDIDHHPQGGNGGDGGDVYLEGVLGLWDLTKFNHENHYKAEDGDHGGANNKTGAKGSDLILKVPIATVIYNSETNEKVIEITDTKKYLILQGGRGGLGNHYFRKRGFHALEKWTEGMKGQSFFAKFELELMSDIIFIGLPNAGKSSALKNLTNADAKVAPYAFTTLYPQLGRMGNVTLMDLPGLIEGTYEGKGLGKGFVKHTKRSKAIAHFISLENEDLLKSYKTIREELKNLDERLIEMPELIVLTKADIFDKEIVAKAVRTLSNVNKNITIMSVHQEESLKDLRLKLEELLRRVTSK